MSDRPLFHLLLHGATLVGARLEEALAGSGVRTAQARVLDACDRLDAPTQAQLARALHLRGPSLSVMVDRLVRAGLVERHAAAGDARAVRVVLTERGRTGLVAVRAAWGRTEAQVRLALADAAIPVETARQTLLALRNGLGGASPDLQPSDREGQP